MALSKEQRDALPDDDFAVPETRDMPMHDERHVRMAWSMVDRTGGLSQEQRARARHRILQRAHKMGIDTKDWVHAAAVTLEAMSLAVPDVIGHPNRMPFSGILTRVDEPSDAPPGGSGGKRVLIPKDVAEEALSTLLGMSVDLTEDFSGHDSRKKVGLITEATIVGNAIHIAGFLYAYDFPEECARVKAEKNRLGFSYECQVAIADQDADPWLVTRIVFTGAAILYKDKAAYRSTSLAANAAPELDMNADELKKLLADALAPIQATVDAQAKELKELKAGKGASLAGPLIDQVTPHVGACQAAADKMEAAGIGTHPQFGHAAMLRKVAGHMLQCAVAGHLPHIYREHDYISGAAQHQPDPETKKALDAATASLKEATDKIASLETMVKDLKAAAEKNTQAAPARRSIGPEVKSLLAKLEIGEDDAASGKVTVITVDKTLAAAGITGQRAIEAKLKLRQAGVLVDRTEDSAA